MTRQKVDIDGLEREWKRKYDAAAEIAGDANAEGRDLTKDEQERYDGYMTDAKALRGQIQREKELRTVEDDAGAEVLRPIGVTAGDAERFSIRRAIAAQAGLIDKREAKLELEISEATAKRNDKTPGERSIHIPFEVTAAEYRDLTMGTEAADIRQTDLGAPIELLRNRMVVRAAGARVLTGLRGDLQFPKHTATNTNTAWVSEGSAPTEGVGTFGQVKISPKQLASFTDLTRQTLLQTSFDVEQFIRADLMANLAVELDRAALHGSGSGSEPTGVIGISGIGDVAGGTNGAAPTWAHIVTLETEVAQDNAEQGALAYITNTKVRGKLKQTERIASTGLFVWQDPANLAPATPGTPLNGYPAFVTNQVSSALVKGSVSTCSAIFYGNWEELFIGVWADLEIIADPYTGSTAGIVRLVALMNADLAVRHPESFAAMKDATT